MASQVPLACHLGVGAQKSELAGGAAEATEGLRGMVSSTLCWDLARITKGPSPGYWRGDSGRNQAGVSQLPRGRGLGGVLSRDLATPTKQPGWPKGRTLRKAEVSKGLRVRKQDAGYPELREGVGSAGTESQSGNMEHSGVGRW